jgi:hypothetical protein
MAKSESSPTEDEVIQPYITALGALTVWWASLENTLLHVAERLTGLDELTTQCLLDNFERASGRASIVKKLALRPNPPSEVWQDCIVDLCDLISNEWGNERNRLIHDEWNFDERAVSRSRAGTKIGKSKAHGRKTLLPLPPSKLTHWEIYDLTEKVMHAAVQLQFLSVGFTLWRDTGKPPRVPQQAIWLSKGNLPADFQQDESAPPAQPQS